MATGDTIGSMTIEMLDNGTPHGMPRVTFDDVGRITAGWLDQHTPYFFQAIEQEHARVRYATPTADSAPAAARRRRSA